MFLHWLEAKNTRSDKCASLEIHAMISFLYTDAKMDSMVRVKEMREKVMRAKFAIFTLLLLKK